MKKIINFDEIFRSCVVGCCKRELTDDEIKLNKFTRACHKLINISFEFNLSFKYTDETVQRGFSKSELLRLYNERLSKKNTTARSYYNLLLKNSPANKCQLCYIGQSESLDHFLPKDLFPSLSLSPNNLIPVCGICNQKKSNYVAEVADNQLLHPRYGQFFNKFFLTSFFDQHTDNIVFEVNSRDYHPSSIEFKRITSHVNKFGLKEQYQTKAMNRLRDFVRLAIKTDVDVGDIVRQELALLEERFYELNISKFTIYQWKWLTCTALLNSPYFLQNAKEIFGSRKDIYVPDYGFD
ncbi:HNH endonuclease [Providencia rettgeri]